jgi:DNA-binding transcriptional MerR regulator
MTARRGLRFARLAAAVNVGTDTIRYYEKVGLLLAPARTPAGYRVYVEGVIDRPRFIQGAQGLGLKLRDIKDLLAVRDTVVSWRTSPASSRTAAPLLATLSFRILIMGPQRPLMTVASRSL